MITPDALRSRREAIIEIARSRGAHDIRIFGSVARGDAGESSDLDNMNAPGMGTPGTSTLRTTDSIRIRYSRSIFRGGFESGDGEVWIDLGRIYR